MARKNITSAGARGRRDGFDGYAPRDTSPEYLAGHAAGVQDRLAARERVAAAPVPRARAEAAAVDVAARASDSARS